MIELTIELLAALPTRRRAAALHGLAVTCTAKRSAGQAECTSAALRAAGRHAAADAFENLEWEASFERARFTASAPRRALPELRP
jgi:hypothetical protein